MIGSTASIMLRTAPSGPGNVSSARRPVVCRWRVVATPAEAGDKAEAALLRKSHGDGAIAGGRPASGPVALRAGRAAGLRAGRAPARRQAPGRLRPAGALGPPGRGRT